MGVHLPFRQFERKSEAKRTTSFENLSGRDNGESSPKKKGGLGIPFRGKPKKEKTTIVVSNSNDDSSIALSPRSLRAVNSDSNAAKRKTRRNSTDGYNSDLLSSPQPLTRNISEKTNRKSRYTFSTIDPQAANSKLPKPMLLSATIDLGGTLKPPNKTILKGLEKDEEKQYRSPKKGRKNEKKYFGSNVTTISPIISLNDRQAPVAQDDSKIPWRKIETPPHTPRMQLNLGLARNITTPTPSRPPLVSYQSCFPLSEDLRHRKLRSSISSPNLKSLFNFKFAEHRQHKQPPKAPPLPPPVVPIWQLTDINKDFAYSPTYPQYFCVPSQIKIDQLEGCFSFRSKGRIPVLSWKRPFSPACILRSSQPLVGISGSHSTGDEEYLQSVLGLNNLCKKLRIIDARGKNAANANHARGAGYEGSRYTNNCTISFMGIENIHTMRDSLTRLFDLLKRKDDGNWFTALESTGWLKHIRLIMLAARVVVDVRLFSFFIFLLIYFLTLYPLCF